MKTKILSFLAILTLVITSLLLMSCDVGDLEGIFKPVESDSQGGRDGIDDKDGVDGIGIVSILKISSDGLVDTYEITLTNGEKATFTVTNGSNGIDGKDGDNGKDGIDGLGISKAEINANGELILYYSDGTSINLGKISDVEETCTHSYTELSVISNDCEKKVALEYCEKCGITRVATYQADHSYGEWISGTLPTCTDDGILGHYHCSVCDKNFDNEKNELTHTIDKSNGHVYGAWIESVCATCSEEGIVGHYHCALCEKDFDCDKNEIKDVAIPKKEHDFSIYDCDIDHHWLICSDCKAPSNTTDEHTLDGSTCTVCKFSVDYSSLTYIAFGDSITFGIDGVVWGRMESPYPTLVADTLKLKSYSNKGISGATFCKNELNRANMTAQILSCTESADIVSLMLGVNDFAVSLPLGTKDDKTNDTIYGSLYLICEHFRKNYPNSFVFFMTPFPYKNGTKANAEGYLLEDVADAIKYMAKQYGYPVLDMLEVSEYEAEMTSGKGDGLHPSQQYFIDYGAPKIVDFIIKEYGKEASEKFEYTINSDGKSYSISGISTYRSSDVIIPSSHRGLPITSIGGSAFSNCAWITSVTLPDCVRLIGERAFYNCSALTSITISDNVTSIGFSAFSGCHKLESVTIGNELIDELTPDAIRRITEIVEFPMYDIEGNIAVIGDSTIAGFPIYARLSTYMGVANGYSITDISNPGDTIKQQLTRWNSLNMSVKAELDYVFVQIGLNDLGKTASEFRTDYKTLVAKIRSDAPNAKLVLGTMIPCKQRFKNLHSGDTWKPYYERWQSANEDIMNNYYDCDAVAYLHTQALGLDDDLRKEYDYGDAIHENSSGGKIIVYSWCMAAFGIIN